MAKTSLFLMTIGGVLFITGVVSKSSNRLWTLLFSFLLLIGGYALNRYAEKDEDTSV